MNRFDGLRHWAWSILVVTALAFALGGCSDGKDGRDGQDGVDGVDGQPAPVPDAVQAAIDSAQVESCATCHDGAGDGHQAVYNQYADESRLSIAITDVQSTAIGGGDFSLVADFSITLDGAPYIDPVGNSPSLDTTSFYFAEYDIASGDFVNSAGGFAFSLSAGNAASNGDGTYTLTQTVSVDTDAFTSGALVGRIANDKLPIEERQAGKRVNMYADNASDHWEFGNVNAFVSAANVESCEACHGAPYFKHGHYPGAVAGTPDFTICKSCHNSSSAGGHPEWQHMVDNPLAWATDVAFTPEEEAQYAYDRTLMNDVHMSHAMEFPYPQSMATCSTCHEGKLAQILDDTQFTGETCTSCHPVQGTDAWPGEMYAQGHRAPPLMYLWTEASVETFHSADMDCTTACHSAGGVAPTFASLHTGFDKTIYDAAGQKYSDLHTVAIDNITIAGNLLTVNFSSNDPAVIPELLVSFYGWDSKNFIVGSHERDANAAACPGGHGDGCQMEYVPESSGGSANPLFTEDAASVAGSWMVTLDMAALQLTKTDDIPTQIANGDIKMAEITITPELVVGTEDVVLTAANETFDLGGSMIVDDYFKGANATVEMAKCNACHDSLASSFHAGSGRGGDGIEVCKNCHTTTFPGSHLEMASRGIDSYVHAIHSFQPFDLDDVATADDPVENARTALHIQHTFPYFTAQACEACHVDGTYNVPDQAKSMPGVLRASWDIADRNIGTVPEVVTGPASRACGGCHRADDLINADLAGDLASFNAHTEAFGTFVENDDEDLVLYGIIDKIMSMFE